MYCSRPGSQVKPHAKRGLESQKIRDFLGFLKFYIVISKVNIGSEMKNMKKQKISDKNSIGENKFIEGDHSSPQSLIKAK